MPVSYARAQNLSMRDFGAKLLGGMAASGATAPAKFTVPSPLRPGYANGMSNFYDSPEGHPPQPPPNSGDSASYYEQVKYEPVGARLPERVANGVFATGTVVLEGPEEFVLDFIQGVARPARVGARIVLNAHVFALFVQALQEALHKYEQQYGTPPPLPKPPPRRSSIQDIYSDLKLPEENLSGTYANAVMIMHSPAEFSMDFITRFFPTAAVSARVYVSAPQVPRMLEAMSSSLQRYQQRHQGGQPPPGQTPPPDQTL
jgi:hypothetical protein